MQSLKLQNENRAQELSNITRSLKNIAREFNIPIIVLSQLSRNVENRINQKPILSDLRESGSIEQDADLVIMLSKINNLNQIHTQSFQLIELIIAKQRNGPIGTVKLQFNEKQTKFLDFKIVWCPEPDSNWWHEDLQSTALPTELSGLEPNYIIDKRNWQYNNNTCKINNYLFCKYYLNLNVSLNLIISAFQKIY